MDEKLVAALTRRVYDLEQLLKRVGGGLLEEDPAVAQEPGPPGASSDKGADIMPHTVGKTQPRSEAADWWSAPVRKPKPKQGAKRNPKAAAKKIEPEPVDPNATIIEEANIIGTWLARIGALMILVGAGFGFKYGVDRGIIGPGLRVIIGFAASALLVGWIEHARGNGRVVFGQPVGAGGVAC